MIGHTGLLKDATTIIEDYCVAVDMYLVIINVNIGVMLQIIFHMNSSILKPFDFLHWLAVFSQCIIVPS